MPVHGARCRSEDERPSDARVVVMAYGLWEQRYGRQESVLGSAEMGQCFIVISGLPGSGKTTLGRHPALALGLPLLDKDAILERLFESKGVRDLEWRRALSRES